MVNTNKRSINAYIWVSLTIITHGTILGMDTNIQTQLDEQSKKIDAIYISVEKTRKYFLVVMWVTIAMVVLPTIGLLFAIPMFINSYMGAFDGLL